MVRDSNEKTIGPEVLGIILVGLAFFFGVALYSYHPSDPSMNVQHVGQAGVVQNLGGIVGAYGADLLMQVVGVAAYLFPVGVLWLALLVFLRTDPSEIVVRTIGVFLFILFLALGLGTWIGTVTIQGESVAAGGAFGKVLSGGFSKYLGVFGSSSLVILLLVLFTVMATGVSISSLLVGLYRMMGRVGRRLATFFVLYSERAERERRVGVRKARRKRAGPEEPRVAESPRTMLALAPSQQEEFEFLEAKGTFHLPPVSLLDSPESEGPRSDKQSVMMNARILEKKLGDYGVEGRVVEVRPGPVITVFEFEPGPGVKVSKIVGLADDLALALSAVSIRVVAPIPGRSVVGVEIPNRVRQTVYLRQIVTSKEFQESRSKLSICLGMDISGRPFVIDLMRLPHLLVAGSTGSGKSVFLNAMICSILFKSRPDEVRFLMIDPKMLELSLYEGIPHLLLPVVTNPKKAALGLSWLVDEMERRYEILAEKGVRNIEQHNRAARQGRKETRGIPHPRSAEQPEGDFEKAAGEAEKLPYIVVIVDELADLMMVSSKEVEEAITRLAQMARAVGIHLILATQRPSVDVITGLIKANFPARISFQVSSRTDSRTILDTIGAEHLLGNGDMLFLPPGSSKMVRVHGAFISEAEITRVVDFLKKQGKPEYDPTIIEEKRAKETAAGEEDYDEKYDEAVAFVAQTGQASISLIQRRFRIGYNRAARIIERMESEGVVGPSDGVKPREVLIHKI